MEKRFFQEKLNKLNDAKLLELLRKLNVGQNYELLELALEEAKKRKLVVDSGFNYKSLVETNHEDRSKLKKLNWAPLIFGPIWTLAHSLNNWTILLFLPFVNLFAIFYLIRHGNRIAFDAGQFESIETFLAIQHSWARAVIKLLYFSLLIFVIVLIAWLIS